jgi:NitT/TauT family transport system ATP-binding protein
MAKEGRFIDGADNSVYPQSASILDQDFTVCSAFAPASTPRDRDPGVLTRSTKLATRGYHMAVREDLLVKTATPPILDVSGVSKTYRSQGGEATIALARVDLTIRPTEFLSLVGPSGCGKTTLMKICAGLLEATEGSISYLGSGRAVRPGDGGVVFQTASLLPWRTILENVILPADILDLDRKQAIARARELLRLTGLGGVENRYPGELSGGMQQRASICRALVHEPEVLFMDEPFGALDAMTREDLNMLLQEVHLRERKTVIFITHSIQEAVLLSDRVVVMSPGPGRVVAEVEVPIPRPRTIADTASREFTDLAGQIREHLGRR